MVLLKSVYIWKTVILTNAISECCVNKFQLKSFENETIMFENNQILKTRYDES